MGRTSFAVRLSPEAKAVVDRCIKDRQFYSVDAALADLKSLGINTSRSALGRYMKAERERTERLPVLKTPTVATIVDCHTGRAEVVCSALPASEIKARIEAEK